MEVFSYPGYREFTADHLIGEGAFGKVYWTHRLADNIKVAVKVIAKETSYPVINEVRALQKLSTSPHCHPLIVCLYDYFETSTTLTIISEFVEGEDLFEYTEKDITAEEMYRFMTLILQGLEFLHRHQIVHRDIKPENIRITSRGLRLMDFGIACYEGHQPETLQKCSENTYGSVNYIDPISFHYHRSSSKSDMYSLGMTFYLLLIRKFPPQVETKEERLTVYKKIVRNLQRLTELNPIFISLITRMLTPFDTLRRPSVKEALQEMTKVFQQEELSIDEPIREEPIREEPIREEPIREDVDVVIEEESIEEAPEEPIREEPIREEPIIEGWYDIYYLICGKLKGLEVMSRSGKCTMIGQRIATSMVKVAATRIFNEPEQAIIEIIANSLDSYSTQRGLPKVGRFGMGFFSILYFLVGHPLRSLHIITSLDGETHHLQIQEKRGNLMFSIKSILTQSLITGTQLYIDFSRDPCRDLPAFDKFMNYLRYSDIVPVFKDGTLMNQGSPQDLDKIAVMITSDALCVEDHAMGIPLEVILNSLLIPSISTKGLKVLEKAVNYQNYSRVISNDQSSFSICINSIAVVQIPLSGSKSVLLSLPSNSVLPVTRDDVIIASVEKEFLVSLNLLRTQCIQEHRNLLILEDALKKYLQFTVNNENREFITKYLSSLYHGINEIIIPREYEELYRLIGIKYLIGSNVNAYRIEKKLDEFYRNRPEVLTNIYKNKKVVLLPAPVPSGSGGTFSYLFIGSDIHSRDHWADNFSLSYQDDFLYQNINPKTNPDSLLNRAIDIFGKQNWLLRNWFDKPREDVHSQYLSEYVQLYTLCENQLLRTIEDDGRFYPVTPIIELDLIYHLLGKDVFIYSLNRYFKMLHAIKPKDQAYGETTKRFCVYSHLNLPLEKEYKRVKEGLCKAFLDSLDLHFEYNIKINEYSHSNVCLVSIFQQRSFDLWGRDNTADTTYLMTAYQEKLAYLPIILGYHGYSTWRKNSRKSRNPLAESTRYIKHVRDIFDKYVPNKKDHRLINPDMWFSIPLYANLIRDLELWIQINSEQEDKIPEVELPLEPRNGVTYTTKQLINYVFEHPVSTLEDFHSVAKVKTNLPLQILEIATNAGTTKSYLEATLTELIQNSMDAVRMTQPKNTSVDVNVGMISQTEMCLTVKDYVGMDLKNIIAMSIPFYSSKTASDLVTGEMGTGFFNIYRESRVVFISTVKNGTHLILKQIPLRESGNITDIQCTLERHRGTARPNGTEISFILKVETQDDQIHVYNRVRTFIQDIISLMDFGTVRFNQRHVKKEKTLLYSDGALECYRAPNTVSYIFTKGVPFFPLYEYLDGKLLGISQTLLEEVRNGLIINIKHGFYTPIQSRTRINIEPGKLQTFIGFLRKAFGLEIIQRTFETIMKPTIDDIDVAFLNKTLTNWNSRVEVFQILPVVPYSFQNSADLLFGTELDSKGTRIATLIQNIAKRSKEENLPLLESLNKETVRDEIKSILYYWLRNKLLEKPTVQGEKISREVEKLALEKFRQLSQEYVSLYTEMSDQYLDLEKFNRHLEVKVDLDSAAAGYYSNDSISIGKGGIPANFHVQFNEMLAQLSNLDLLKKNPLFNDFFGCGPNPVTLPHELQHARARSSLHGNSPHLDVHYKGTRYTYDHFCNYVTIELVSRGLLTKWFSRKI